MCKKSVYLGIVLVLLGVAGVASALEADVDIQKAEVPPVIDGIVDEVWSQATKQYITIHINDTVPSGPADCSGHWQALYDSENLYALVDVNDETLKHDSTFDSSWQDDAIELYVDADNSKGGSVDENDHQYCFRWFTEVETPRAFHHGPDSLEGHEYAVVTTADGYLFEIKIPWTSIHGAPAPQGKLIGIDCFINDDDAGGGRDTQLAWYSTEGAGWNTPSLWGTAWLVPGLKASNPDPPDGAENITVPLVKWLKGRNAAFHDVYFGTNPNPGQDEYRGRQGFEMYYHGPGLTPGATHYWRIDEVAGDGSIVTGDVWSFVATPATAYNPIPADGAMFQDPNVDLSWSPGMNAVTHDVYFGTDQAAVAAGDPSVFQDNVNTESFDPGTLALETTYYWRIDEVEADGVTKHEGAVWSFTTTRPGLGNIVYELWEGIPGTNLDDLKNNWNYPGNPSTTGELNSFDWNLEDLSDYGGRVHGWLYVPADGEYTFSICTDDQGELWLSTNDDPGNVELIAYVKDSPTAGGGWAPYNDFTKYASQESEPISLMGGQRYYIMALWKEGSGGDHCQVAWQGPGIPDRTIIPGGNLSPFIALWAYGAKPSNGATNVTQTPTLEWIPGIHAVQHDVYFGMDEDAVANATTTTTGIYRGRQNTDSYTPGTLQWDTTYYWRIDEVNNLHPDSPWIGSVWSFTTANFVIVDDFEHYTDFTPDRIWQTWRDGFGYNEPPPGYGGNGTGSQVGNDDSPFTEQTIVHSGSQAMTFRYTNNGSTGKAMYSEAAREWTTPQNWTQNGVKALTLWFYGDAANSAERLYVGVQDSLGTRKDVPHENLHAVQAGSWQEWNIDLQQFAAAGVNLTSVKTMYIGVGNRLAPQMGGTGTLYFDDIRLYKPRCVPDEAKPAASFNDDCIVDDLDLQLLAGDWLMQDVPEPVWNGTFTSQDVGAPSVAGSYSFDGTTYTIQGDGHDIWDNADDFHYAFRQISGDTQMTVRVTGVEPVHAWAKAGIMIRDTLDAGSANAMVAITGGEGNGGTFQWRTDADGSSGSSRTLTGISPPSCVKLVREGDTFTGYIFLDGKWQQEGTSATVAMTDPVYIGLAVTSHTDGTLTTATFDRACTFSAAELHEDGVIDFKDYAVLADAWLEELLWP